MRRLVTLVVTALVAMMPVPPADAALPVGTVLAAEPMSAELWVPGTTAAAYRLTYITRDARGNKALSTGAVFLPPGPAPTGGWPVVSWAHGTVGIGDGCAPSRNPRSKRDATYLATWMKQGYAIVATDYAGLGTPGVHAYLHERAAAHNVVDMVVAARSFASSELPLRQQLARKWVVIGQSQGAGAAVTTARYATAFGGADLDYRGAVATGTPAYIENYVQGVGGLVPPVWLPGIGSFLTYILVGLRDTHPELGIDQILTPTGRKYLALAERACMAELEKALTGVAVGTFLTKMVGSQPGAGPILKDYLALPLNGFDKPFFMGHGLLDTAVPSPFTLTYGLQLQGSGQPVTFKAYLTEHSGTMAASLKDSVPFVARLFG